MSNLVIDQKTAREIDDWLLSTEGGAMTLIQLMEVAGNLIAVCCANFISTISISTPAIYVVSGNGNNGGDGLVAARCLNLMGFPNVTVVYENEKPSPNHLVLIRQLQQCTQCKLIKHGDFYEHLDKPTSNIIVLDCITGFGCKGSALREPWAKIVSTIEGKRIPIIAVDVPSGWSVDEKAPESYDRDIWQALISLTYPKRCSVGFDGRHYLAGRFLTQQLMEKFNCADLFGGRHESHWTILEDAC